MDRRSQREAVFKMLFEASFKSEDAGEELYAASLEANQAQDSEYIREVDFGVLASSAEIDEMISGLAKGWKVSRISAVSLCILRVSIYEMKNMSDRIPFAVSINEAVELTKKYDDDAAPKFVNGILNAAAVQLGLKE